MTLLDRKIAMTVDFSLSEILGTRVPLPAAAFDEGHIDASLTSKPQCQRNASGSTSDDAQVGFDFGSGWNVSAVDDHIFNPRWFTFGGKNRNCNEREPDEGMGIFLTVVEYCESGRRWFFEMGDRPLTLTSRRLSS